MSEIPSIKERHPLDLVRLLIVMALAHCAPVLQQVPLDPRPNDRHYNEGENDALERIAVVRTNPDDTRKVLHCPPKPECHGKKIVRNEDLRACLDPSQLCETDSE